MNARVDGRSLWAGTGKSRKVSPSTARNPAFDHLESRQKRSVVNELGRDVLALRGEDVFRQPAVEWQVVGDPAKQRHGGMRVRVDEAGQDDVPLRVVGRPRGVALRDLRGRTDSENLPLLDRDGPGVEEGKLLVHRHDPAVDDEQVGGILLRWRSGEDEDRGRREQEEKGLSCHSEAPSAEESAPDCVSPGSRSSRLREPEQILRFAQDDSEERRDDRTNGVRKDSGLLKLERLWKELSQLKAFLLALRGCRDDRDVAGKLPENLAASAAGRRGLVGARHDGDGAESADAFRERFPDRDPLGADGQAVRRVLDVAASPDPAALVLDRRADGEAAPFRDRVGPVPGRGLDELLFSLSRRGGSRSVSARHHFSAFRGPRGFRGTAGSLAKITRTLSWSRLARRAVRR